jgi:hypothetical protein
MRPEVGPAGLVTHFGHVHPSVGVPCERYRAINLRLRGGQLNGQPFVGEAERRGLLGRRKRSAWCRFVSSSC